MSISLSEAEIIDLKGLASSQGISQNEALNKAIATEIYIRKHTTLGGKVLLKRVDESIVEVVFR